jgi:cardiolipin synthase
MSHTPPRISRLLPLGLLWCLLAPLGCAWSRPAQTPAPRDASALTPIVIGEQGLLTPAQSEEIVEDAVAEARYRERAEALVKAVQAATGAPLIAGNAARVLVDGPHTYEAMFAAVRAAKNHVHVETYIFDDGDTGRRFGDLLIDKRRQGVTVRVIYDAIGSIGSDKEFFAGLAAQQIEIAEFRPLEPATLWRINNRDHRKLVIVDGRVAYTGGINISDTYSSGSSSRPGPEKGRDSGWRDTHIEIRGPAVKTLQSIFLETWHRLGKPAQPSPELYPGLDRAGDTLVQVMASDGGDSNEFRIYDAYMTAIRGARQRIWITQAYFAPTAELRQALADAVTRGVDVRVIVPGFTDSGLIFHASRATYDELLKAGVRLFEYQDALLHSKTAVVDGIWSTVGTCNVDPRSFAHNNELNAAVVGREFARSMETLFQQDLKQTRVLDAATWKERPTSNKMKEFLASLFSYWL